MSIPVLAYHSVRDRGYSEMPGWMTVPTACFADQMAALARAGYRTPSRDDFVDTLTGAGELPSSRTVLITFDDGYRDNHDQALPVLRDLDFEAVVFLVGDLLPGSEPANRPRPRLQPTVPMLAPDEITTLLDAGWTVGSHGMSHVRLPELPDDQVVWELEQSRLRIQEVTGHRPRALAYPYGAWDNRISALATRHGFEVAFTMRTGPVRQSADPLAVRRIPVYPSDTPARLLAKLNPVVRTAMAMGLRTAEILKHLGSTRPAPPPSR